MEVEKFLDLCDWALPPIPASPRNEPVESDGQLWDPDSGAKVGNVFVSGYIQFRKRTFSRYSRRARFMTEVMNWCTDNTHIHKIMRMFDRLLTNWKEARPSLERVYFLNVRCVLFFVCERLNLPLPYPKQHCLRDLKRFERQKTLFEKFV